MIALTRMDKQTMYLNPDHISSIEETPDTVITLFNGNHYIVIERAAIIISRVVAFRSRVIRRTAGTHGRKYLNRQRKNLFRHISISNAAIRPATLDAHDRTPYHSLD
ncbi:MAG: flagellar FlbD family protein [Steroidobacteraceae bacterium]|nr:flagellar FlbD family protein [Deltaproteobacteria bacterium]